MSSNSYNRDNQVENSRSQSLSLMTSKCTSQTTPVINEPQLSEEELLKSLNKYMEEYVAGEDLEVRNYFYFLESFHHYFMIFAHMSIKNIVVSNPNTSS